MQYKTCNGWVIDFRKNIHMYTHSLKATKSGRTFDVECEDNFNTAESEERDQILVYFNKVMRICGVQNSGELFNVWRYGFPYGWFL